MAVQDRPFLYALFGLNRAGQILWGGALLIGGALFVWTHVGGPAARFSEADERLFRAARHGDRPGVEQALDAGAGVNDPTPTDGRTAIFRAAVLGHADAVRVLIDRGAEATYRGNDGRTALEIVTEARGEENDAAVAKALDEVATVLRGAGGKK